MACRFCMIKWRDFWALWQIRVSTGILRCIYNFHLTKFQPNLWLPSPVQASFDVFWSSRAARDSNLACVWVRRGGAADFSNRPSRARPGPGPHIGSV